MLHKALEQFLTDVFWDDPEFLPGRHAAWHRATSRSVLSQYLPRAEVSS
jgi:ATP-binding protein involved in chromosome partitioning